MEAMTLTDFLLARIAEDEETATMAVHLVGQEWHANFTAVADSSGELFAPIQLGVTTPVVEHGNIALHIARHDPARVLAECEARRNLIVEMAEWSGTDTLRLCRDRVLYHLALPYADHPDYREEWRP